MFFYYSCLRESFPVVSTSKYKYIRIHEKLYVFHRPYCIAARSNLNPWASLLLFGYFTVQERRSEAHKNFFFSRAATAQRSLSALSSRNPCSVPFKPVRQIQHSVFHCCTGSRSILCCPTLPPPPEASFKPRLPCCTPVTKKVSLPNDLYVVAVNHYDTISPSRRTVAELAIAIHCECASVRVCACVARAHASGAPYYCCGTKKC